MLNPTPDFREGESILVAGIGGRYSPATKSAIPILWDRFVTFLGHIPNQSGMTTYGVCSNRDAQNNFNYLCAVPVTSADNLLEGFHALTLPASRYAVFHHGTDLSTLSQTWAYIFNWLPDSTYRTANAPAFERYSPDFCPESSKGSLEIWMPIEPK